LFMAVPICLSRASVTGSHRAVHKTNITNVSRTSERHRWITCRYSAGAPSQNERATMKKATDFARLLSGFLTNYLPNEKGVSVNTVKSYSYTFILFIKYMREIQNVPLTKLTFSLLNKKVVAEFLNWLQKERRCSAPTRNQRLAACSREATMHSFWQLRVHSFREP
jgi:hypothetical protein